MGTRYSKKLRNTFVSVACCHHITSIKAPKTKRFRDKSGILECKICVDACKTGSFVCVEKNKSRRIVKNRVFPVPNIVDDPVKVARARMTMI